MMRLLLGLLLVVGVWGELREGKGRKKEWSVEDDALKHLGGVKMGRVVVSEEILDDDDSDDADDLNRHPGFSEWRSFKTKHGKTYESREEEMSRFSIYRENKRKIDSHNHKYRRGHKSFEMEINQFADMSSSEFQKTMNGFRKVYGDSLAKAHGVTFLPPMHVKPPRQVDWRHHGYVTPVKNQGQCGSCWSFSATGALEGQHFRKTGRLVSLSEQNLVDCSGRFGNQGCNGGLMDQAFQYVKVNGGIDTEASYPYDAKEETCRFNRTTIGAADKGFVDVDKENETALRLASASVGPISVAIDASHPSFQFYKKGVYVEPDCSEEQLDHGVLVVGYGVDQQSGGKYWLVKNSWGPMWGENGYIKMARNHNNMCGIASSASYPLV